MSSRRNIKQEIHLKQLNRLKSNKLHAQQLGSTGEYT